jgi:hypothetical protein
VHSVFGPSRIGFWTGERDRMQRGLHSALGNQRIPVVPEWHAHSIHYRQQPRYRASARCCAQAWAAGTCQALPDRIGFWTGERDRMQRGLHSALGNQRIPVVPEWHGHSIHYRQQPRYRASARCCAQAWAAGTCQALPELASCGGFALLAPLIGRCTTKILRSRPAAHRVLSRIINIGGCSGGGHDLPFPKTQGERRPVRRGRYPTRRAARHPLASSTPFWPTNRLRMATPVTRPL